MSSSPNRKGKPRKRVAPTSVASPSDNPKPRSSPRLSSAAAAASGSSRSRPMNGKFGPKIAFEPDSDSSGSTTSDDESVQKEETTSNRKKAPSSSSPVAGRSSSRRSPTSRKVRPRSPVARKKLSIEPASSPSSSDSETDEDNGDDETDVHPTTNQLSRLCWKCHCVLKQNSPKEFVCYAVHVHPILQVPMCSACSEEIANHQRTSADSEEDDLCHGCAEPAETLFLCDRCPRQFCSTCVAQSCGGGERGWKRVEELGKEEDDWMCLVCGPEPELEELQQGLDQKRSSNRNNQGGDQLSQDSVDAPASPLRKVETILQELDIVEAKQREIEKWDDPEMMASKREEFLREIRRANSGMSKEKLEAQVEDEMKAWLKVLAKHGQRLGDMITSLQEELEVGHGMDLAKVYRTYFGDGQEEEDDEEEEPEWKKRADEEIRRRDKARPSQSIPHFLSPSKYERETYVDVEDLMTKAEDEQDRSTLGEGFRSTSERPTPRQIELALRIEDDVLAEHNIPIRRKVDNDTDKQEEIEEQKQTSQQGSDGSKVRRDTFLTVQKERRAKRVPPVASPSEDALEAPPNVEPPPAVAQAPAAQNPAAARKPKPFSTSSIVDLTDDRPVVHHRTKRASAQNPQLRWETPEELDDDEGEPDEEEWPNSQLVLSSPAIYSSPDHAVKTIAVSSELEKHLKPHQKQGIMFMYRNVAKDLNVRKSIDQEGLSEEKDVGGCILAHSMGLGKSLTTISLLHTLLIHPSLVDEKRGRGILHTAMLIVPKNTIESWKSECRKWTADLKPSLLLYVLGDHGTQSRSHIIHQWSTKGGVIVVSKDAFAKQAKSTPELLDPGPDVVVIDEAHLCLSSKTSVVYKALELIKTKRRILLTGSPFMNNALEYYRMCNWIRPEVLEPTEAEFITNFSKPIMDGLPSDASNEVKRLSSLKSKQLNNILRPYVHRKDASVLREFLPPLQQVVLHVKPTKVQTALYIALTRWEKRHDQTNFLHRYSRSRPIHNHPACLLMQSKEEDPADRDDGVSALWWKKPVAKIGEDKLKQVRHGGKIVLLLHILTHAHQVGDKVVVFANCLKTLDYIEETLRLENWAEHCKSLKSFPGTNLGGWEQGEHYLRLDGSTDSAKRGSLISQFNKVDRLQLFLISRAGNVGITLTAANRVVLMDSHFNPTVMNQALFRCYRFGQAKPVFVYRFLTEGTSEEKVYSRSVNKEGLSMRVIDGKAFEGSFTNEELSNLVLNDTWVQCERCEKWRMLKGQEEDDLPDKWYCEMNVNDSVNNTCDASEKDNRWYHKHFQLEYVNVGQTGDSANAVAGRHQYKISAAAQDDDEPAAASTEDSEAKEAQADKDEVLRKLLAQFEKESKDPLDDSSKAESKGKAANIAKWYFHDALLEECDEDLDGSDEPDTAAEGGSPAEGDAKVARKPSEADDESTGVAPGKQPSFKEKLAARKRKESLQDESSDEANPKKQRASTDDHHHSPSGNDGSKKRSANEDAASMDQRSPSGDSTDVPVKKVKTEEESPFPPGFSLTRYKHRPGSEKKGSASASSSTANGKESSNTSRRRSSGESGSSAARPRTSASRPKQQKKGPAKKQEVIELSSDEE